MLNNAIKSRATPPKLSNYICQNFETRLSVLKLSTKYTKNNKVNVQFFFFNFF